MVILLTGFGPFGVVLDNPSARLAASLASPRVEALTLPTSFARAPRVLRDRLRAGGVSTVLMLGVAESQGRFAVERQAHNLAAARIPDVDGAQPRGPLVPEAPAVLPVTLPPEATLLALEESGAELSSSAGSYVCNALLFHALLDAAAERIGFVHVPPDERTLDLLSPNAVPFEQQRAALAGLLARLG